MYAYFHNVPAPMREGLTSIVRDSGTGTRGDGLRNGLTQAVRYTKSYNLRFGAIIYFFHIAIIF